MDENKDKAKRTDGEPKFLEKNRAAITLGIMALGFFGSFLHQAINTEHGYFLIATIVSLGSALWLYAIQGKYKREKRPIIRTLTIGLALLFCAGFLLSFGILVDRGVKTAKVIKNPLQEVLVEDSFANSIIIVLRLGRWSVSDDVQCDVLRQQDENIWITERSIPVEKRDCLVVRALKPGLYRVELSLYGVRQDIVDDLSIGPQKGQYVELGSQGFVGKLRFKVVKKDGSSIEDAHVVLYTHKDFPFRDSNANEAGETGYMWVSSVLYNDDYYIAKVFYPGKAGFEVGTSERIVVRFDTPGQPRTILIRTNLN